jgi:hypothetical protein
MLNEDYDFHSCNAVSLERARRFGGTYHLHLQGRRVSQAISQQKQTANYSRLVLAWLILSH